NTLVMRTDLSGDPSFQELLSRVREVTLGAYAHQDLPFERLVKELHPERNLSHNPLFQAALAFQNVPSSPMDFGSLAASPAGVDTGTAKFDLTLGVEPNGSEGLRVTFEYSADLFDDSTIARMLGHFLILLEGIAANPATSISVLPLLTEAERHQLLVEWNDTTTDYPRDRCIHQLFEEQVERTPDGIAVEFGEERLTYAELNRRANQLGHYLQSLGVGPDTLVGVAVERSLEMVVGLLGILKAGGAYLPLDPSYPMERLAFMMDDARLKVLLTQRRLQDILPDTEAQVVLLDKDQTGGDDASEAPCSSGTQPGSLAYVMYSSGSTGRPKGVAIQHDSVVALISWARALYGPEEIRSVLFSTSICFDISVFELFVPLSCGGKVVLAADVLELKKWGPDADVSLINTVPSAMAELVRLRALPRSARVVNLAGEAPKNTLAQALYGQDGVAKVYNLYGPTESTVYSTVAVVEKGSTGNPPIGRPISNSRAYVLDSHGQLVPIGVPGELYIGGAGLARAYLNRPDLTAEKFMPDPFSSQSGARMYRTGDQARYLPDGNIEFLGRADHQVKIRGFRVELGEIESVLGQHPGVQDSVVIAPKDPSGDKRLVAYLVPSPDRMPNADELRAHLKAKLPDYMIPSAFVLMGALPLTPNGKVDRKALPDPDRSSLPLERSFVAPRTPLEEKLAALWAEILGIERVGVQDDFFDLGGHSLLAARLLARIRDAFGRDIPLAELFRGPTIEQLAALLMGTDHEMSSQDGSIPRRGGQSPVPLSFAQERLWFLDRLEPNSPLYLIPTALRLSGHLDIPALQQSLDEIVRRHEALRTTFSEADGSPVQVVNPPRPAELASLDLSDVPANERIGKAHLLLREEARRPFDLSHDPMLRPTLVHLDQEDHILLLVLHHIASDGWSQGVLFRELGDLYRAYSQGEPSPLPELPIQYADYALWQREWLRGEVLEEELGYWRERLADSPPLLELPTDRPRPAVQSYRGATQSILLPEGLVQQLEALSRQEGVTLFMTLLAAFQTLLSRYTGQEDIPVGCPVAGRTQAETEGLIGFFVNTLVMRTDLSGDPSFQELLSRVREVTLGAYAHQDLPFERLVEELHPERNLSHNPLFQVALAFENTPPSSLKLPGLVVNPVEVDTATAKFDLTLYVYPLDGKTLKATLEYNTDLFDDSTISRMLGHIQTLLEGVVADPDQKLSTLPLLTEAERHQLLVEWNDTYTDYPRDRCIHQLFEEQVDRTPDATAVVFGDASLSYAQLNARANQLARHLRSLEVGPELLVGVAVERSLEMVVGLLGILKAGGAYLPLDPSYP
ncbi:MAG: amino acid adenylation domain-containing protein, partial [Actinobacteria bacterium]|nr:amino acid adenylation domain-containing protein [Actinomycetota bacterium]